MKRLALIPLLLFVAVPPAVAQVDVVVDPDSPAGKEYAVPLDQARDEASGGGGGPPGDRPLFGEGIEPAPRESASAQESNGAGKNGRGSRDAGAETREGGGPGPVDRGRSSVAIEAVAADGSSGLLIAGIAAAVLLAGLACGLGLRRLLRGD